MSVRTGPCLIALLAAAAGCAPSVRLETAPEIFSTEWRARPGSPSAGATMPANLGQALGSTELEALIGRALAANADLGAATARIRQARAQLRLARAEMLPVVNASVGLGGGRNRGGGAGLFNFSEAFAGLEASWDLDLAGEGRAGRRSALSRYAAASFDRDAVALLVQAEVARAFVQHATLTERLALLDRSVEQARELLRIVDVRLRLGEGTRVDTGLQTIQLRQLQVDRERLVEARVRTANALAILAGEEAPRFTVPAARLAAFQVPAIAAVQPAELLVRRPDIRAAEARIAAANGDVEQARAAFLPRIRLSASALGQGSVGGPLGIAINLGSSLLAPIFDGGRLRGNLDLAGGRQAESVELYRQALLTALSEGEDALEAVERARARESLLVSIVSEAATTARLSRLQYVGGEADLQWVTNAEQLLVEAQDARALALQERLEAAIDLYRAMGGSPDAGAPVLASRP